MSARNERIEALDSWHDDWRGIRVAVLGLGVTGFSVADTLVELGCVVHVIYGGPDPDRERLVDVIGATRFLGGDDEQLEALERFEPDLVIVSPGYRPYHPLTVWAEDREIPVWGDIQLGWRLRDKTSRIAEWITVTGTNGKTTTAQLTAHMLVSAGVKAAPVGNIGTPILDALRDPEGFDVLVVELSSFQLHRLGKITPYSSVCLNFADDHLDWHGSREEYLRVKSTVYENTRVACVYNRADPVTEAMVEQADVIEGARAVSFGLDSPPVSGLGLVEDILVDRGFHEDRRTTALELMTRDELQMRGLDVPHLIEDVLAAAALARSYDVSPEAIANAVGSFTTDQHRVEHVATLQGVTWVDDSKATNAHAAEASLRSFRRVIWIVGGLLKGASIDALIAQHHARLRTVVVIGEDRRDVVAALERHAHGIPVIEIDAGDTKDVMSRAVIAANRVAQDGDTVLLSPAAASMDQFESYEDRGKQFQQAVFRFGGGIGDGNTEQPSEPDPA